METLEKALVTTSQTSEPSTVPVGAVQTELLQALTAPGPSPLVKASDDDLDLVEVNEVAADLLRRRAADLVSDFSVTRRETVRLILAQGVRRGLSDQTIQRRLNEVVGLDPKRAAAVQAYRTAQVAAGVKPDRAAKQAAAYAQRLTRARVKAIVGNEVHDALMQARRLVWADMQARGDYSPYAVRVTVVTKDERLCPICRPQNGRRRSLKGDPEDGPPFHPNCRCTEVVQDQGIEKREDDPVIEKAISPGGRPADASPLGHGKGPRRLVNYVRMVAHALMRKRGMSESHAIAAAKNALRRWAAGGDGVSPKVQAAAAKALAEQEALDKKNRVSKADRSRWNIADYTAICYQIDREDP